MAPPTTPKSPTRRVEVDSVEIEIPEERAQALIHEITTLADKKSNETFRPYTIHGQAGTVDPAVLLARLTPFVEWLVVTYNLAGDIRPCWYRHPGAVEMLAACHASWSGAYEMKGAHPSSGQAWHGHLRDTLWFLENIVHLNKCERTHEESVDPRSDWRFDQGAFETELLRVTHFNLLEDPGEGLPEPTAPRRRPPVQRA
jgi:hypothetical protein